MLLKRNPRLKNNYYASRRYASYGVRKDHSESFIILSVLFEKTLSGVKLFFRFIEIELDLRLKI